MSRSVFLLLLTPFFLSPASIFAQDKDGLPPRYQAFAKDGRLRLTGILGTPELHGTFRPTSAFSADGKRAIYVEDLTTGEDDKPRFRSRLLVWDVVAKGWPREIDIDGKAITALALSADGSKVLLGGHILQEKAKDSQSFLSLWDLQTGKEIRTVLSDNKTILAVALAADENTALAATSEDLKAWDLKAGKSTRTFADNGKLGVSALAFLPGEKQFLAGFRGGEVQRFDLAQEKPLQSYKTKGDHQFVWHLDVSRDGKRFVVGDAHSGITVWDIGGKEINSLRLEKRTIEEFITAVALAPDGRTVLSTWGKANPEADDFACTRLIVWDVDANKTLWSHVVPCRGRVPMHLQGDLLTVGGGPNLLETWSVKEGKQQSSWGGHKSPVNVVGVLANGGFLSAGHEGSLITWQKGQIARTESLHKGAITSLALSNDRKRWLSAGADLQIYLGSSGAKEPLTFKKTHAAPITSLAFSTDGKWAASGSGDRTAKIWNLDKITTITTISGHSEGVNAVAFSPDDRWLATGSDDATIKVWPIKDGKLDPERETITLEKHTKPVTSLAFTPDGKRLLSGSQDQKLMVWDLKKGSMDFMIPGHKNWVTSILLLDAKTVLTSSDDLTVAAWNLEDGMEIGRIDFGTVGDCPRCLAPLGPDRFLVGTSSWLICEFQILPAGKSKAGKESSK